MSKFLFLCAFWLGSLAHSVGAYELSIAAIFQNEGPYLQEWIEYHRMVGVEHFWMYHDSGPNNNGTDNSLEVLQPYISKGLVEVIDWPIPSFRHFHEFQIMAYRDALKRSAGVSSWLALIDIDEFLLPTKEATVTECLKKHFAKAAGVYVNWRCFGTGGLYLKEEESVLFTLTACSEVYHPYNCVGKSIVRPECTLPDRVWYPHHFVMQPSARYYNGDAQALSFKGLDLCLDGKVHNKFIRINHYTMRDENFFHNVRLVRARGIGIEESLIWSNYHAFNMKQDHKIINFINKKHPSMYQTYWQSHIFK